MLRIVVDRRKFFPGIIAVTNVQASGSKEFQLIIKGERLLGVVLGHVALQIEGQQKSHRGNACRNRGVVAMLETSVRNFPAINKSLFSISGIFYKKIKITFPTPCNALIAKQSTHKEVKLQNVRPQNTASITM
ncbi:MAG: hypothetical protein HQL77_03685 [Magnetococcales bacterium]|nr:hypothetical protein [Magnetococcales bacterium]